MDSILYQEFWRIVLDIQNCYHDWKARFVDSFATSSTILKWTSLLRPRKNACRLGVCACNCVSRSDVMFYILTRKLTVSGQVEWQSANMEYSLCMEFQNLRKRLSSTCRHFSNRN